MSRKRRILIDGVDGIGKSTQCKLLSEHLKIPVIRMPDYDGDIEQSSFIFNKTIVQFDTSYIVDRGYMSSVVYSDVLKRKVDLSYIEDIKHHFTDIIILASTTDEFIKRKDDNRLSGDVLRQINERFIDFAFQVHAQVVNIRNKTSKEIFYEITKNLDVL